MESVRTLVEIRRETYSTNNSGKFLRPALRFTGRFSGKAVADHLNPVVAFAATPIVYCTF
jgi:hypothetical protein